MNKVKVGMILWQMRGIRQNNLIKWAAMPYYVEEILSNRIKFAGGSMKSINSIGKTIFFSRKECLDDFMKDHLLEEKVDVNFINPENVSELPRTDFEDVRIYQSYTMEQILHIYVDGKTIPESEFIWEEESNPEFSGTVIKSMTLSMLSKQWYEKHNGIITVVTENPLHGDIYQIGNYPERKWSHHGTTKGYA